MTQSISKFSPGGKNLRLGAVLDDLRFGIILGFPHGSDGYYDVFTVMSYEGYDS